MSLDTWSPNRLGTGLYNDENSAVSSPNNSFMQVTLEDFNNLSGCQKLDNDDLDFCSVSNSNRSSVVSRTYSVATSDSGSMNSGRYGGQADVNEDDFSSRPWMNPKYEAEEKHSCVTWPFRK